ncbi:MAG: hypothetical protein J6C38_03920 [Oscillospiraceae bacterium]|nr:hypothetical protein [Oscillospiraceae bacterium]
MKKFIALAAFAAILLCGCANDEGTISTSRFSSCTSSSSVDPLVSSIMSDLDISIPEGGTTSFSHSGTVAKSTVNRKATIAAEKTYVVKENKQLIFEDGGELTIEGKFDAQEGCKITIKNGGALILNGESSLNSDLYIEEGGKLIVGENGKVSGSGTIYTFNNDCIENSQNIETSIKITG